MDKLKFYDQQHISAEDMEQIYLDVENFMVQHLRDFHTTETEFVLGSTVYGANSLKVSGTAFASITVEVSGGVGYDSFQRIEVPTTYSHTMANIPPNLGGGLIVTRIDLIYLERIAIDAYPFTIDLIDYNRNIYQDTKYTRYADSYEVKQLEGTYNIAGGVKPVIPDNAIPLAFIHLRDNTNKIYNYDTGSLDEGYVEDARVVVYANTI